MNVKEISLNYAKRIYYSKEPYMEAQKVTNELKNMAISDNEKKEIVSNIRVFLQTGLTGRIFFEKDNREYIELVNFMMDLLGLSTK